jgi:hypothetical protein
MNDLEVAVENVEGRSVRGPVAVAQEIVDV